MRKTSILAAVLAIAGSLVPLAAQAEHCNNVYFFSRPVAVAEHNAVGCIVDGTEDTDARVFVPGSSGFTVRYVNPEDPSLDFYWVDLSGSLYPAGLRVKAPRITLTGGGVAYETAAVNFPNGRSSVGCVTATVETLEDPLATNTYRTVGATC